MLFSELFINALTVEEAGAAFNPIPQFKNQCLVTSSPGWLRGEEKKDEDSEKAVKDCAEKKKPDLFPPCMSLTKLMLSVGASAVEFPLIGGHKK